MAAPGRIEIKGQKELELAFMQLRRETFIGLKAALIEAGKAVSDESHQLIPGEASNIGDRWSQFRIGATVKGVYVAPKSRRRGGSPRPNLAGALKTSMESALDAKKEEVIAGVEAVVDIASLKAGL